MTELGKQPAAAAGDSGAGKKFQESIDRETTETRGARPSPEAEQSQSQQDLLGAEDPASFLSFLMSIASSAAASLRMQYVSLKNAPSPPPAKFSASDITGGK